MSIHKTYFLREETNGCTLERWRRREGVAHIHVIRYTASQVVVIWS